MDHLFPTVKTQYTEPHSWVPVNLILGVTLLWTTCTCSCSISSRGVGDGVEMLADTSCCRKWRYVPAWWATWLIYTTYAYSPRLSRSFPRTDRISCSPIHSESPNLPDKTKLTSAHKTHFSDIGHFLWYCGWIFVIFDEALRFNLKIPTLINF